jgi:hypothetical protein
VVAKTAIIGSVALKEKLGSTAIPPFTASAMVLPYASGVFVKLSAKLLNLSVKWPFDWKSVTIVTIPSDAVTIQKKRFWMRSSLRQPPSWMIPANANMSRPKKINQPLLLPAPCAHKTSPGQSAMRPTATQSGTTPAVTTASPKNAFERRPAVVMQKTDIQPMAGWMTRLTSM